MVRNLIVSLFALVLGFSIIGQAFAATFNPATVEELIADIQTANGNMEDDEINLVPGMIYTITAGAGGGPFSNFRGNNGLPIIQPDDGNGITINGNGATIQRDPSLFIGNPCNAPFLNRFRIFQIDRGADLTLIGVTIQNGCVDSIDFAGTGGGIYSDVGSITIMNSTIVGNEALFGGGIYSDGRFDTTLIITNSSIVGNEALFDGGIVSGGPTTLTNVTIADNVSRRFDLNSGGVSGDEMTLTNVTIAGNVGAGIQSNGVVNLKNTLMVSNTDEGGINNCTVPVIGTFIDNGGNISDGNEDDCAFAFNGDWNTAAMLGPLQDNGGGTPTRALIPTIGHSNPAIDNPAICAVTDDQRFFPRPSPPEGNCDTGAFEFQHRIIPTRNIPTLSEWGLIALAGILGFIGLIVIRRKKVTA